ncbi:MAG: DivIVA domain-containing protein [Nitrospira sp.]|nr:DivIVA domain-containing protein [Nitrospira sp.]
MKITPLDIQQMVFQVKLRGYDREEVNRFLEEISQTVEVLNRDNVMLRDRIESLEQQVSELKRTETTLSNTLVSAQSLADDVKRSAQRDADLIVKEAELKAGELFDKPVLSWEIRSAIFPYCRSSGCSWLNECVPRSIRSKGCWMSRPVRPIKTIMLSGMKDGR